MGKIICLFTLLLLVQVTFAQQRQVAGTVTNKTTGIPLEGVTVQAGKGVTVTDGSGKFSVTANKGDRVIFTFTGMKSFTLTVNDNSPDMSVKLEDDPQNLNEIVVVGYTTEKKKDLKGAVAVVKVGEALKETNSNLLASLQGRIAGVNITTDGAPGSGTVVNIRGISSILGDIQPLYIVDGVPTKDINGISPNDIESLQVMKDAASAAIYGARGANGVIVIATKRGKSKQVQVTFDAFYGTKKLRGGLDMLNAQEYGQVLWQQKKNDNQPLVDEVYGSGPAPVVPAFIDAPANTLPAGNVDYLKEVYQPAANMAYNLGITKAADKSNFYFGLNYNREEGLAKYTLYDRLTLRLNSSFKVSNRITFGENLSIGYLTGNREPEGRTLESAIFQYAIIPLKDNLGNWGGPVKNLGDRLSPIGQLYLNRDNKNRGWRTFGNVFADIEIIKGLTYRGSFAVDQINSGFKGFYPKYTMGRFTQATNSLSQNTSSTLNLTATHTLNYAWQKAKHDVQLLAGYEWIHNQSESFFVTRRDFALEIPAYQYLNGGTALADANGGADEYGLIGSFGKLNYSYDNKYLIAASVRRDGSSRFGPLNRYGVFPAVSAAWRISEEKFFKDHPVSDKISDLKLRASWGKNGNDGIPNYTYSTNFISAVDYSYYDLPGSNGPGQQVGYYSNQIGNPLVKWEASKQTNIGLDLGIFSNRLYLTADYYIKTTDDLLYPALTPGVLGEGRPPFINVGDIKNSGIELLLSYRNKSNQKLKYNFDLTFTSIKNRAVSVGTDGNDIRETARGRIIKGQPLFVFYGYEADGIFKTQKEVDDHATQAGKGLGRIRYRDINGDKQITPDDRTYLGSPFPKFTLGLNTGFTYGDFDATLFFDATVGNKIYDEIKSNTHNVFFNSNHHRDLLNAWSPANTNSDIPMLTSTNTNDELRTSSYYISSGTFFRMKSAVIGYNLSKNLLNKVHLSKLRVFVQAQNLFTITSFEGFDYEPFGFEGRLTQTLYPHSRSVTFGVNVGF
ncbi:MAG: TonB-dependent receptor [Ferruginibacter sp.]|nr:TonB-dependent receptor [Ferruginibacter sp.]